MPNEPRKRSRGREVARLLLDYRESAGLAQTELAERARVSRSRIIAAEAGTSLPTIELCLKLARALAVPLATMVQAHVRDSVHDADPTAVAEVEAELGGRAFWSHIADRHGLRVEHGRTMALVDERGDLTLRRRYSGCFCTRPRRMLVFRERIVGERPPSFTVKEEPRRVGYDLHATTEGEWRVNRLEFHKPWTPSDGPFEFELETFLPRAYVLEMGELEQRQAAEPSPIQGRFRSFIRHPFERLDLSIAFPTGYTPSWQEPLVHWDTRPLDESDEGHGGLEEVTAGAQLERRSNEARLILQRPLPGFTFGIRWKPVLGWSPPRRGESEE